MVGETSFQRPVREYEQPWSWSTRTLFSVLRNHLRVLVINFTETIETDWRKFVSYKMVNNVSLRTKVVNISIERGNGIP